MKICTVIGSPRKQNTYRFAKLIEERIESISPSEVDYLFLNHYKLKPCRGCMSCVKKGEKSCPDFGAVDEIRSRMTAAQGVILSSPVYNSHISSLMKNLVDHFIYLVHRPCFYDHYALVLVTTQYSGLEDTTQYLHMMARQWGFNVIGNFGVKATLYQYDKQYGIQSDAKLHKAASQLVRAKRNGEIPEPTLEEMIYFRVWQQYMEVSAYAPVLSRVDYEFWRDKGLLNRAYFTDIRTPPLKDAIARGIAWRARRQMDKTMKVAAEMMKHDK